LPLLDDDGFNRTLPKPEVNT